ncbi:MAG: hypothetical protein JNL01_02660 [Bdellovibrionales bacterium]|nr:hypothetical protein [Bdellovibrionales bacterium]
MSGKSKLLTLFLDRFADLRFAIGLFFSIIGILLLAASLLNPNDVVVGIRLNFVAGAFMGVFGALMLLSSHPEKH